MAKSGDAQAILHQAVASHRSGDLDRARRLYRKCLKRHPDNADALHFLGLLESQANRSDEAEKLFSQAVASMRRSGGSNPNYDHALNNLGNAYRANGKLERALDAYREVLCRAPDNAMVLNNAGIVLKDMGELAEARQHFLRAVALVPGYVEAHANLGNVYRQQGLLDDAVKAYRKALALDGGHAGAHINLAHTLLALGDYEQGWREYEWRWKANRWKRRPYRFRDWKGDDAGDKTVLVFAEQGVGDELMFASCYGDLAARAGHVVVECDPRLEALFSRSFPAMTCRGMDRSSEVAEWLQEVPAPDVQVAAGTVPLYLRPGPDSFPSQEGYLVADPDRVADWRNRYRALGPGFRVGISWRGGSVPADRRARSLDLMQWQEIFTVPGVTFVNLQYGDCREDIELARNRLGVEVHHWEDANPLKDMDSFAAQIQALDLVLSIDNSTVHMAGALGAETWVMQPFAGDWRWRQGEESSCWYPSLRQFWQPRPGDWDAVKASVARELARRAGGR